MVNEMVAKLTSACWDKCITSAPGSKLSSSESSCLSNCAHRYMDMSLIIMKRFPVHELTSWRIGLLYWFARCMQLCFSFCHWLITLAENAMRIRN
ncbi:hypothetical protein OIU84_001430 [Salix udensis]|uniref:Mitochondrial import inner membrane translocase subunit n=1 Tax=Salix udensis TaxID=889485 RepID=A0AAD6K716_9ROSI|nr:hypothetical protein OIU84_001430 [Salix udensis]